MQAMTGYLAEVAGLDTTVTPRAARALPQFLRQRFRLFDMHVEGHRYVIVEPRDQADFKPAALEKQLARLPMKDAEGYCLLAKALPGYVRKRLIERRIPFVIPGSQLYWPAVGGLVHPRSGRQQVATVERLTPAAQVVVLHALNGFQTHSETPKALALELGYSAMTLTRALSEIDSAGLARVTRNGRERLVEFARDSRVLWKQARPMLKSPVAKTVWVPASASTHYRLFSAGESALAARSMLVAPTIPVYAISSSTWQKLRQAGVRLGAPDESANVKLQIWRYDPALLTRMDSVDVFSLYLSLVDESDERVQTALDEIMERRA